MRYLYPFWNFLQLLFLIVWSIFWISAALIVTVFTLDREMALILARRFWGPGLRWAAGVKLAVENSPNIDRNKPHIYIMNHQSMFDIVVAFIVIPQNIRFVAKNVLKYIPFLGWYMWITGMIFVDRGKRAKAIQSLARAGKRIRDNASILVYPEGTRSENGKILPFKKGPFVLSIHAKVPIVPVALEGSGACLPRGGFRLRPGVIRVKFGAPISTTQYTEIDRNQLMDRVRNSLLDLHSSIGGAGGEKHFHSTTVPKQSRAA